MPLGAESSVFRFVTGAPDRLALLRGQISRVRPEFPRLFSLRSVWLLSSLLLFQTLLAFALLL